MNQNKSIVTLSHNECCGCFLCGDVCPVDCIGFKKDLNGFLHPHVDESHCVNCGLCSKFCPAINKYVNPSAEDVYAAYSLSSQNRDKGSSGGIWGLLAETVLNEGGKVWGAAFGDNLRLAHRSASDISELLPLYKSKYIQSDMSEVYNQIAQDLKSGIFYTMFCGTPCQCNALKNYIGDRNDKLLLVDFVCHGVPSQDLFDKSISWYEKKNKTKVTSFTFRYKGDKVKHPQSYMCTHKGDDTAHIGLHYQFPFYFGFQKYITLRDSCYECKWASSERTGDITLGDFWGVEKYDESLNSKDGVSLIILNTPKGHKVFMNLVALGQIFHEVLPMSCALSNNSALSSPSILKQERELLFCDLRNMPFDQVVKKYLTPKRKWIFDSYYMLPRPIRQVVRKIMDKRMKYE